MWGHSFKLIFKLVINPFIMQRLSHTSWKCILLLLSCLLFSSLDTIQAQKIPQRLLARLENMPNWSCAVNVTSFPLDPERIAGVWYEAARIPKVEVTECLNVTAPSGTPTNNYTLDLEYYTTIGGKWKPTHETVMFPWNEDTQNGVFKLNYEGTLTKVLVVFKLVFTDYKNVALICGYSGISPIPLFKLMTRTRELSPAIIDVVNVAAKNIGIDSQIVWEEQAIDKCSSSDRNLPVYRTMIMAIVFVMFIKKFSLNKIVKF